MSSIIGFRPTDGGDLEKRLKKVVTASKGKINSSDILRAALEAYLTKLETSGEMKISLEADEKASNSEAAIRALGQKYADEARAEMAARRKKRVAQHS